MFNDNELAQTTRQSSTKNQQPSIMSLIYEAQANSNASFHDRKI